MGVAEVGSDGEIMQEVMAGELGAVVEGDGLPERLRHGAEQVDEMAGDAAGRLAGEPDCQQETGLALMHGEYGLTVF